MISGNWDFRSKFGRLLTFLMVVFEHSRGRKSHIVDFCQSCFRVAQEIFGTCLRSKSIMLAVPLILRRYFLTIKTMNFWKRDGSFFLPGLKPLNIKTTPLPPSKFDPLTTKLRKKLTIFWSTTLYSLLQITDSLLRVPANALQWEKSAWF